MITAAQAPVLALLMALGGVAKFATARGEAEPGGLTRLGPAILVPDRLRVPAMMLCAFGELVLATGLMVSTHPFFRWGTTAFFAVSTYVLWELRRRRPDVGCGCFGEVSAAPVGLRAIGRTVVLAAMALTLALTAPPPGWEVMAPLSPIVLAACAAGLVLVAVLSPELEETIARLRYRAPCERRAVPAGIAFARLRSSSAWRAHRHLLVAQEPTDSWRELCWRFFVYPGRAPAGDQVDVVFAVYLSGRRPPVRVALVTATGDAITPLPESVSVSV
jgi:hypothetical protein